MLVAAVKVLTSNILELELDILAGLAEDSC